MRRTTVLLLLAACSSGPPLDLDVVSLLDAQRIRDHVEVLTDEALGGRIPGSPGAATARDYILGEMDEIGLEPIGLDDSFVFPYANAPIDGRFMRTAADEIVPQEVETGYDLVGMIPADDPSRATESVVLMGHFDHLGVDESGDAFNGAFDNASAVGTLLELARVMRDNDVTAGRNLVFMFTDDEESGLDGAAAWVQAPTLPLDDVVMAISADPLGRPALPDWRSLVIIGLERSPLAKELWQSTTELTDLDVHFINRDAVPIFASDQDVFHDAGRPACWFVNPGFSYYHTVNDTADTLDYDLLVEDAAYLGQLSKVFGDDTQRYAYEGSPGLDLQTAVDGKALFDALAASSALTDSEREQVAYLTGEFDKVIQAGTWDVLASPEGTFTVALYFILFDLGESHKDEIPT